MTRARSEGKLRPFLLGVILDALSLNAVISTAVVIDSDVFDKLFKDMVFTNAEGEIIATLDERKSVRGLPFDQRTVTRLTEQEPLGQTSAASLRLAWGQRGFLLA